MAHVRMIDAGSVETLRSLLDGDIDVGLIGWAQIDSSLLKPFVNTLSGEEVVPQYEEYVKRITTFRKAHPSRLSDSKTAESMLGQAGVNDAAIATAAEDQHDVRVAIDSVLRKYAQ